MLGGPSYEQLTEWRDTFVEALRENNPGVVDIDWNYKETQPQYRVQIDYNRAADLGVTVSDIGNTLQTMLGSRRVTTYVDNGEEYDVILEGCGLSRTRRTMFRISMSARRRPAS